MKKLIVIGSLFVFGFVLVSDAEACRLFRRWRQRCHSACYAKHVKHHHHCRRCQPKQCEPCQDKAEKAPEAPETK